MPFFFAPFCPTCLVCWGRHALRWERAAGRPMLLQTPPSTVPALQFSSCRRSSWYEHVPSWAVHDVCACAEGRQAHCRKPTRLAGALVKMEQPASVQQECAAQHRKCVPAMPHAASLCCACMRRHARYIWLRGQAGESTLRQGSCRASIEGGERQLLRGPTRRISQWGLLVRGGWDRRCVPQCG